MTAVVIAGAGVLLGSGGYLVEGLEALFELGLTVPREALLDASTLGRALLDGLATGLTLLAPIALATIVAAIAGTMALGGWSFSTEALVPNFGRLNPVTGLGRIASWHGVVELLKALAKFALVASVAGLLLWRFGGDFLALGSLTLHAAIGRATWLVGLCLVGMAAS